MTSPFVALRDRHHRIEFTVGTGCTADIEGGATLPDELDRFIHTLSLELGLIHLLFEDRSEPCFL